MCSWWVKSVYFFFLMILRPPRSTRTDSLFPYTTLFRSYRNLGASYVQTGLAIDPHRPESGCMRFIPGSHLRGDLGLDESTEVLGTSMSDAVLHEIGRAHV